MRMGPDRATRVGRPAGFVPALALLCLTLAAIAVFTVWPRFDGLYGQDPFAYYEYARDALDRALRRGGRLPEFFWPPGFPLVVRLAMEAVGPTPLAGQVVALSAGALAPVLTALLARELFVDAPASSGTRWLPPLAGCLVAFQAQLWQSSVVVMSDTTGLAAGTAGVWLTARWGRTGRAPHLWLGAGLLAFAVLTRWAYALVAIPVTIFALHRLASGADRGRGEPGGAPSTAPRRRLRQAVGAAAVVLGVLSPIWVPAVLAALGGRGVEETNFTGNLVVHRWSPLNAFRRTFATADGLLEHRWPNGLYYALAPAHPYFFTPLLAAFLAPGFWRLWTLRNAGRGWLIAGWAGVVLAFHAGAPYQNFRFTLAFLPPLAIVAGLGIATVWEWLEKVGRRRRRAGRALVAACVVAGLGAMARGGVELTRFFVERKAADLATVEWVEARTPPDARVLALDLFFTLRHYGSRETESLFFQTPETVDELASSERPAFVLLETDSFLAQWAGHPSWEAFRRLRERPGLVEVGRDREYVLYRVGPGSREGRRPGRQRGTRTSEPSPEGSSASRRSR